MMPKQESIYILMRGSTVNPIDIDSDHEEQGIEVMKEVARNKQIIETAIMTKHPLEIALAVIKTTIKGDLQHKNLTLNKAIIKYFEKEIGLNISFQNFHTRPETEYGQDNQINPKEFIVYGVDFLTTGNIKDRFNLTDLKQSELVWVNSSVCKLKYLSADVARTVLESVIEDVKGLKVKVDEDSEVIPIGWFKLKKVYEIYGFDREMFIRYATESEKDMEKEKVEKYEAFEVAQDQLLPTLFDQFQATHAYQEVIVKIERERNMGARRHNSFGGNGIRDRNRRDNRSRSREMERDHRGYNRDPMNGSFDMREGCSYEPEQHRMRVINRVFYEHEPVQMRKRMRNDGNNANQRRQDPARRGNTYFDHNGLDDIDNLSFEYREEESRQSHGTNLDMSFNLGENPAASSKAVDMSFNLADDLDVSSKKAVDMSFNLGENLSDKSMLKQDMSFVMNSSVVEKESKIDASFAMGKSEAEKEAVDASFLFEKEEASPIHPNPLDAGDFPMLSEESTLCKTNSGLSLLNRKTEKKGKVQINLSIDEQDQGY